MQIWLRVKLFIFGWCCRIRILSFVQVLDQIMLNMVIAIERDENRRFFALIEQVWFIFGFDFNIFIGAKCCWFRGFHTLLLYYDPVLIIGTVYSHELRRHVPYILWIKWLDRLLNVKFLFKNRLLIDLCEI